MYFARSYQFVSIYPAAEVLRGEGNLGCTHVFPALSRCKLAAKALWIRGAAAAPTPLVAWSIASHAVTVVLYESCSEARRQLALQTPEAVQHDPAL